MKVFNIICTVIFSGAAAQAQTALTSKTEFLEKDGRKIAYRSIGKGSPIILINRFRGTLDTWDPLFLDELAKNHRVVTFDYSGIGYSTGSLPTNLHDVARDVKDVAEGLNLKKTAIAGWSYGGLVAQTALVDFPELVTHAILIGTNPIGKNELPLDPLFLEHALKPVNDFNDETVLFFEPKSEESVKAAKASHDRIFKRIDVSKIPSTMEVFKLYFAGGEASRAESDPTRAKFIATKKPVLTISGDHDISFPVENWFKLLRQLSTTEHIVFPHTGHAPQHQYPELTAEYITSFLKRTR
ncbi:alpha/beta hydrolase [Flavobacterium sp. MAH-1]|uniref:Alpha/beta hydrolase n=1 Tax=Flavobacterium agri TaxID=2743471 RepID=A0A7Y9C833_9FLAO|nr:alpha/beta hydrolase [Flavobacterium agri]NUY81978.1 alpha/beta hydrolase [Flavobacterium agri]NYA72002.1 alpha/beta hydrolase [Flavobacterium agri]